MVPRRGGISLECGIYAGNVTTNAGFNYGDSDPPVNQPPGYHAPPVAVKNLICASFLHAAQRTYRKFSHKWDGHGYGNYADGNGGPREAD